MRLVAPRIANPTDTRTDTGFCRSNLSLKLRGTDGYRSRASKPQRTLIGLCIRIKLCCTDGKPAISLNSRWNRHFRDVLAYEQENNSRQHYMDVSGVKNPKSKMEFHRELKLASRASRVGVAEKREVCTPTKFLEVLEIDPIEDIECINADF